MYDANDNIALLERVQSGDDQALDELLRANMGLVKSLALRFTGRGAGLRCTRPARADRNA